MERDEPRKIFNRQFLRWVLYISFSSLPLVLSVLFCFVKSRRLLPFLSTSPHAFFTIIVASFKSTENLNIYLDNIGGESLAADCARYSIGFIGVVAAMFYAVYYYKLNFTGIEAERLGKGEIHLARFFIVHVGLTAILFSASGIVEACLGAIPSSGEQSPKPSKGSE